MKNFIFKSSATDLQKMFQLLETIQKNVLYLTYRTDTLLKKVNSLTVNEGLQKQVDQYFQDDVDELGTSHQTDSTGTNTEGID